MNKLVIPAILVSITLVAGIFAFMPVEKVSTVHTTIASNIDDQNRAMTFAVNMSASDGQIELIPSEAGVTFTGSYVISTLPASTGVLECGLTDGTTGIVSVPNGTETAPGAAAFAAAVLSDNEGISVQVVKEAGKPTGVCQVTIVLDSAGG